MDIEELFDERTHAQDDWDYDFDNNHHLLGLDDYDFDRGETNEEKTILD